MKRIWIAAIVMTVCVSLKPLHAEAIRGNVVDASGTAMEGVMVSAFDEERRQSTSVFSQADGSFAIDGLRDTEYSMRARLMGQLDEWLDDVNPGATGVAITMQPATGEDLEDQRPANSAFNMLKFANLKDKMNFKMMCSYCHQVGTIGFRTPEKPVDWETMLRRMDGFGGLYKHTQETIVKRLMETYKDDAINEWQEFAPPPPPTGTATKAKITAWEIGKRVEGSFHDLELGPDGLVYAVNISKHRIITLDPETSEQRFYGLPRGSYGPHSIELANDGNMWITLCASGQMGKFDLKTKEFTICSSAEAPAKRGSYPHTLRINPKDPEGLIWYTDAGRNSCFSLHPETLKVKEYHLLRADQAVAAGKGESRGITPYGLDFSPVDGTIWYSKLNGNRIGRIDPTAEDGNIKEWNPPFRGPRRLHVAPDGIVWVPGFGSGVFGKFDPQTEEWTVYDLPDAENQIPYALNIDPKGYVWICGTGNDTLNRFDPKTEELVEFRLPMRVSYTREIEFDSEGNVWTSTSGPARHMERGFGAIIKLQIVGDHPGGPSPGGYRLSGKEFSGKHLSDDHLGDNQQLSPNGELLARIDRHGLPDAYDPGRGSTPEESSKRHQDYVDRRMAELSSEQRARIGELWAEKQRVDRSMSNAGASFVRIMEYVAEQEQGQEKTGSIEKQTKAHRLTSATGVIGVARFAGPRPERERIPLREKSGQLSDCHSLHENGLLNEDLIVGENGGLANVFVYVKQGSEQKSYPAPKEPAVLNQEGCMFQPRVQGVMIGQDLVMKNGDPVLHNVRALSFRNRPFNIAQPAKSPDRTQVFTRKEKAVMIQCDLHPWMKAWYFVMDHPWFAVTDEQGQFQIEGLPAGEYTLAAWHEELGEQDVEVTVSATGASEAAFLFKPMKSNVIMAKSNPLSPTAMKPVPEESLPQRLFVKKWTVEELTADATDLTGRSIDRGRKVFSAAGCIKCHPISGQGAKFGPELTDVAKRFQGPKLLEQVLKPSSEIHKEFQTHLFLTDAGKTVSGLVMKEDDVSAHVLLNPLKPEEVTVLQKEFIEERRMSDVSTMPEALLDTFEKEEILDLLSFLQAASKAGE